MNLRGFQLKTALVVFSFVLLLGLSAQYFHQQTQVLAPLTRELQNLAGVESVHVFSGGVINRARTKIELDLKVDVPLGTSLSQAYQVLDYLGGSYLVELKEQTTPELLKAYEKIQIMVEEAVMSGGFALLEQRVEAFALEQEIAWELGVDRNFVYLRLQGYGGSLVRAILRQQEIGKIQISQGGWANG